MKTLLVVFIASMSFLNANDINIDFGCYDCKKQEKNTYEKVVKKSPKETSILDKIEIDGDITIAFEKEIKN